MRCRRRHKSKFKVESVIFLLLGYFHDFGDYLCDVFRFGSILNEFYHDEQCVFVDSAFEEVADLEDLVQGISDLLLLILPQTSWQAVHLI